MLKGSELGAAIREAMRLKSVTQKDVAAEFGVKQPSVSEWLRFGRIDKGHLNHLVAYFSDVVAPSHWGLGDVGTANSGEFPPAAQTATSFPRSGHVMIRVNLAVPEAAVLHRMVRAAGLPGVVVGEEKWKESKGPQLGKFSTEGVPTAPAPQGLAVVKTARKQPATKAPTKKEEK